VELSTDCPDDSLSHRTPARGVADIHVYPNPFNPQTTFHFTIGEPQNLAVTVFDVYGRRVRTLLREYVQPGDVAVVWNGRDEAGRALPSGGYFLSLRGESVNVVRKVMLVK
jgi:flagellar hook assembly protein FlgD